MLNDLMSAIQDYLMLSKVNTEHGARRSLELVGRNAHSREGNVICVWLEEI